LSASALEFIPQRGAAPVPVVFARVLVYRVAMFAGIAIRNSLVNRTVGNPPINS